MKKGTRIAFSALVGFIVVTLVAAVWPLPATTTHSAQQSATNGQAPAQTQSVSGKIASVEKDSFTLTVGSTISNPSQQLQQTAPKTMKFVIDKNTTVDGKLQVGANADVTYREDSGKNLAISVRVTS